MRKIAKRAATEYQKLTTTDTDTVTQSSVHVLSLVVVTAGNVEYKISVVVRHTHKSLLALQIRTNVGRK